MKRANLITLFIFFCFIALFSFKIINAQATRIVLDEIIEDIPKKWWEGGWDKKDELQSFIQTHSADNRDALAKAQYWIGCNYYSQRDNEAAIAVFKELIQDYADCWFACAKARFEIGQVYVYRIYDYDKAIVNFRKVISDYPKCEVTAQAQRMIGYTLWQMRENEKAFIEYGKVWGNYPQAKLEIAKAYWESGNLSFQEALKNNIFEDKKVTKLTQALSFYKQAYLYCPDEEAELAEWTVDAIVNSFKILDGNRQRADDFIRYQRYVLTSDNSLLSEGQSVAIQDPLKDF